MKTVAIESPYKADTPEGIAENVKYAQRCMLFEIECGRAPFASHLLYTQVLDDADPQERELGIKVGFAIADSCDFRAFYIDRGVSEGMLRAAERAGARDQPMDIVALDYDAADENPKGAEDVTKIQRAYARGMLYMEKND